HVRRGAVSNCALKYHELPERVGLAVLRERGEGEEVEAVGGDDLLEERVVLGGRRVVAVDAVRRVRVTVVGTRDQRDAAGKRRDRLAELQMLLERPVARRRDDDDLRRLDELERDLGSPVERELRRRRVVAAVRDAEDRQAAGEQRVRGGAIGLVLPDLPRDHDCVVALDVDGVRRDDDRDVGASCSRPPAELLHRGTERGVEIDVAVRRDAAEDETHGRDASRETSRSRKRGASTSTPTSAFGSRPETPRRSTTVLPSQKADAVSTATLTCLVSTRVGSASCATAIASWMGAPSKRYWRSWKSWKKSESSATKRPARPASRSSSACARVKSALCVTSSPISVIGMPLAKTSAAASGSTKALNSAAGVTFPSPIEPPIQTIRSSRSRT